MFSAPAVRPQQLTTPNLVEVAQAQKMSNQGSLLLDVREHLVKQWFYKTATQQFCTFL